MNASCFRQDCPGYGGPFHLHVSALGDCMRKQGYAALGSPKSDPQTLRDRVAMEIGIRCESLIFDLMADAGYSFERPVEPFATEIPFPIVGRPDGALIGGGRRHSLDGKALRMLTWAKRDGVAKTYPGYLYQLMGQAWFGEDYDKDMGYIAALDKTTNTWDLLEVPFDNQAREMFTARLGMTQAAYHLILNGELPNREYDGSTYHCQPRKGCEWSSTCWGGAKPQARPTDQGGLRVWEAPDPLRSQLGSLAEPYLEAMDDKDEVEERVKAARSDLEEAMSPLGFSPIWWPGLTGSRSEGRRIEEADKAYLRSVLTPEQYARAFSTRQVKPYWTFKRTAER